MRGRDMTYREPDFDDSDAPKAKPLPWRVDWDNGDGHACGTFPDRFATRREAEAFARDWKREMVAADPEPSA